MVSAVSEGELVALVRDLYLAGYSQRAIAERTGLDRTKIRNYGKVFNANWSRPSTHRNVDLTRAVIRDGQRRCSKCQHWKPLTEEFWSRDSRKASGFRSTCKSCRNDYQRLGRMAQASQQGRKYTARDVYTKREKISLIRQLKASTPCADCGHSYPHYVMDFDHRPDEDKVAGITPMANMSFTWDDIENEIAKCDIVCSNCHRARTWLRHAEVNPMSDRLGW